MSLDIWLSRGKKVAIGGREFMLVPLPLKRLYEIGTWLEENCNDVVKEVLATAKNSSDVNPFGMVTKVLLRVNANVIVYQLLSRPKNPDTGEPLNTITQDFIDEYLDPPTAQEFFKVFIEINQLEDLIKNLQRLPVIRRLMEVALDTFGLRYLNSLLPSTDSVPKTSEGSLSPRSTGTSTAATTDGSASGSQTEPLATEDSQKKELIQ
jgi:hypothetical protein